MGNVPLSKKFYYGVPPNMESNNSGEGYQIKKVIENIVRELNEELPSESLTYEYNKDLSTIMHQVVGQKYFNY